MSRVNTVPVGLQSLLGNTNMGDNPSEFAGIVAPTLEQFPFLATYKINYARTAGLIGAQSQQIDITIPENELWMLICTSVGVYGAETAGDQITLTVEIQDAPGLGPANPSQPISDTGLVTTPLLGQVTNHVEHYPRPFLLQPSTKIAAYCNEIVRGGAAPTCQLMVMYYKLGT